MHRLFKRTAGMFHPLIYGAATLIVFFLGKLWPRYDFALWTVFLTVIAGHAYIELRRPVNYTSMAISEDAIEYVALGQRDVIPLKEIMKLQLVRERALFDTGIESKWVVYMANGRRIEVMDEWPDRKRLMRLFAKRLPGFDVTAARSGLRAWKEGVWPCFASQAQVHNGNNAA
jgi:hypothetical protein